MRRDIVIPSLFLPFLFSCASPVSTELVPEGVTISQWVREDIFAGFVADSMDDFNRGVAKLDAILAEVPDNGTALVWKAAADSYLAVKAHEAGEQDEYQRLLKNADAGFSAAYASGEPHAVAALGVTGGAAVAFGDRLADADHEAFFTRGRDSYLELLALQKPAFDKMPVHHRGELLGGLAQLEQRLGNREKSLEYAGEVIEKLAGTPYESSARAYITNPEAEPLPRLGCNSCHEPGSLANVMARASN